MAETLQSILEQFGLDLSTWIPKFNDIGIAQAEDIIKGDFGMYQNFFLEASEEESQALQNLLEVEVPDEEYFEKSNKQALDMEFDSNGLDPTYWPLIFYKVLGVRSPEGLQYIGNDNYTSLEPYIRNAKEKLRLRSLTSYQAAFEDCHIAQIQKMDQRKAQLKVLLEKFNTKSKYLSQSKKQYFVHRMFELLQITSDIPQDITTEEVCTRLGIELTQLVARDTELNDTDEFINSLHGYALKGIYLTPKLQEQCEMQKDLLKCPKDIKLINPVWNEFSKIIHFSNKESEDHFIKAIKHQGISAVVLAEQNTKDDAASNDNFSDELLWNYRSTLKYIVIPKAACYLDSEQLELSSEAIKMLQEIEILKSKIETIKMTIASIHTKIEKVKSKSVNEEAKDNNEGVNNDSNTKNHSSKSENESKETDESKSKGTSDKYDSKKADDEIKDAEKKIKDAEVEIENAENEIQQSCNRFFHTFGSHAYKGVYHYGGIFIIRIYTEQHENSDTEKVKVLQRKAIEFVANSIWLPEEIKIQSGILNGENSNLTHKIKKEIITVGGLKCCSSYFQWKNGLTMSTANWAVIDHGTNILPVWEIVKIKHRSDFEDVDSLASSMSVCFEKSNISLPKMIPQFLRLLEESKIKAEKLNVCSKEQQHGKCEENLYYLVELKNAYNNCFINPNVWPVLYLSNTLVQEFLKYMVTTKEEEEDIVMFLRQIANPIDIGIAKKSDDMQYIARELYASELSKGKVRLQRVDFLNLQKAMKHGYLVLKESECKNCTVQRYIITIYIEEVVEQYFNHLKETAQVYEFLFLCTLLYPFNYDTKQKKFWQLFHLIDMEYLSCIFENQTIEFYKIEKEHLKLQAYLFNLTCTLLADNQAPGSVEKAHLHVKLLKDELKGKLTPKILEVLEMTYDYNEWSKLASHMLMLYKGYQLENQSGGQNLTEILQLRITKGNSILPKQLESTPTQMENNDPCNLKKANFLSIILQTLSLLDNYPEKLTTRDATLIRLKTLGNIKQTDQQHILPYLVLQKIMLCDTISRECLLVNLQPDKSKIKEISIIECHNSISSINDETEDDEDYDDDSSSSGSDDNEDENNISPMDVIFAILHCSDNFLRQDLLRKLSLCQFAIPCLLPDHLNKPKFLKFGMLSIIKAWKSLINGKICYKECRIVEHRTPFISFLKLGKLKISKSAILNTVISNSKQEYFFNWNSDGGNYKKLISDGVIEVCWYLPSGNKKEFYDDALTFLNLRGHALKHAQQLEFIIQVSCMLFILLGLRKLDSSTIKMLKQIAIKKPGGLTILFHGKRSSKKVIKQLEKNQIQCSILILKNNNDAEIRKELRSHITERLKRIKQLISLSECVQICHALNITVDEDYVDCQNSKQLALHAMEKIKEYSPVDCKSKLLPLQGPNLWHQWAQHDKERNRHVVRYKTSIEHYNAVKDFDKIQIRKIQLKCSENLTSVMTVFLNNLLTNDTNVRKYFIEWMKILLDDYSRTVLPQLHREYQQSRKLLLHLKDKFSDDNSDVKEMKYKLKQQNEHLAYASFGIEHFFREIGQIYEARMDPLQNIEENLVETMIELPRIVANLVSDGYPMEIMDGDASHVPITWVKAVLKELKLLHAAKKLFVISVLGIQSTGKSTLLNTMFGLQFNVSAGRCTRGVFLQLLSLDDQLKHRLNCDLIVIIDTEGLRAPELQFDGTQAHDNELATFVIGLADVTIINIYGETPGDLDDILQTAIHAFIRMKKMTFHPKCHFVHQNVSDISASDKGKVGRQAFLDNLDKITEAAAKIENCEGHFKSFKSVIAFNEDKDVHFFPALWKGDPPMAPVNSGYSEQAQRLKSLMVNQILDITNSKLSDTSPLCTFVEFEQRITHLWDSVLQENFIFSFKNSLEIVAYNELDTYLNQWTWKFQDEMQKWQLTTENKINSCCAENLQNEYENCIKDGKTISKETYESILLDVKDFFEQNEHAITLAQWRGRTEERILQLQIEFDESAAKICKDFKLRRQDFLKIEKLQADKRKVLKDHIEKLVKESKESSEELTDEELGKKFEIKWKEWKSELSSGEKVIFTTDEQMYSIAEKQLQNFFKLQHKIIIEELKKCKLQNRQTTLALIVEEKHLRCRGVFGYIGIYRIQPDDITQAQNITRGFLNKVKECLTTKKCQNFTEILIADPLKQLHASIISFNDKKKDSNFLFTNNYIAEIAIIVSVYAVDHCKSMMSEYKENKDPLISLGKHKTTFKNLFISMCRETSSDKGTAESFCQLLISPIKAQLLKVIPNAIKSELKDNQVYFKSKKSLKCMLLHKLAEEDEFKKYKTFLDNVDESYKWYIACYIKEYCDEVTDTTSDTEKADEKVQGKKDDEVEDTKYNNEKVTDNEVKGTKLMKLAKDKIDEIYINIKKAVGETSKITDLQTWLKQFHENLNGTVELKLNELTDIIGDKTLNDYDYFIAEAFSGLCKQEEDMKNLHVNKSLMVELKNTYSQATELVFEFLSGCTEQCPFCNEYCEMSVRNHLEITGAEFHSICIHRPQCLAKFRYSWNNKLVIDLCTSLVGSDLYFNKAPFFHIKCKEYQSCFPKWNIQYDASEVPIYWKWFVGKYNQQIASWCGAAPGDVPQEWCTITKDQAIKSLKRTYGLS